MMRHRSLLVPASLILLGVAGACDRTPDYVLKKADGRSPYRHT